MKENNADYMLSIESDVLINDENLQRLKKSFNRIMDVGDVGVYQPSLTRGSSSYGTSALTQSNSQYFNSGTNQFRNAYRIEGWCKIVDRKVLDGIMPHISPIDNKYGWGVDCALCRMAIKLGKRIVVDDTVMVTHPLGCGYSTLAAQAEYFNFRKRYKELGILFPEEDENNIKD